MKATYQAQTKYIYPLLRPAIILVASVAITGCSMISVLSMLPGAYLLLPAEYYYTFDIDVNGTRTTDAPAHTTISLDGNPYEDEDVEIRWRVSNLSINLDIHNKTSRPLRIHWSESSIMVDSLPEPLVAGIFSLREGVTHTLDTPGFPQAPSVLAPLMRPNFRVFPYSHSRWQPFTRSPKGFWTTEKVLWDLEPKKNQTKQEMQALAGKAIGRTIRISLLIEVSGVREIFVFDLQVVRGTATRINW